MSSIVYLKNKTNGKTYAYLNESVWDSETGKCKCKRKCLGHLDPVTGDIVPNRGKKDSSLVTVKSIGVNNLLEKVSEKIGLTESIKAAFPTDWKLILSFMFYNLREPTTMSRIRYWSQENETPFRKQISEDLVINLFQNITENSLFSFYREWRDHFDDADFFTYYVSSVSSFERRTETIRFNDLPMMLIRPETVISMTYNMKSGLPVVFDTPNRLPVNLTDIRKSESKNLWLDFNKVISVLDMDYCNEENLGDLLRSNSRFLLRASPQFPLARNSIEKVRDRIMDLSNYKTIDGNSFFVMSFVNYIGGRKCFVHIYYSTTDAEKEFSYFLSLIDKCESELKNGVFVREHEQFYQKYFLITDRPGGRSVEKNGEAIMSYNDVAGFVVLISNVVKNPTQAITSFMNKGVLQKNFDNLLNEKDRANLRLYIDANHRSLLFLRFLSFILFTEINDRIKSYPPTSEISFTDVMNEMSSMKKITIGDKAPVFTQVGQAQAKILKAFGINVSDMYR